MLCVHAKLRAHVLGDEVDISRLVSHSCLEILRETWLYVQLFGTEVFRQHFAPQMRLEHSSPSVARFLV